MAKSGRSLRPTDLNCELVTRITTDMPAREEATATKQPGIRAANRFVVGLILVFEACAAVAVLLMLRLAVRFVLAPDHAVAQITSQAARFLPYWAMLLYVHAIALAWFRRANSASSALCGFAGIVYLGCGYVFSLVLASAGDVHGWPEELKAFVGIVVAPNLTWLSCLAGCLLLLRALGATAGSSSSAGTVASGKETRVGSHVGRIGNPSYEQRIGNPSYEQRIGNPSSNEADLRDGLPIRPTGKPTPISLHKTCAALLPLVGATLLLVTAVSVVVIWRTGTLVATWLLKQSADRSLDFLGAACYGGVYLLNVAIGAGSRGRLRPPSDPARRPRSALAGRYPGRRGRSATYRAPRPAGPGRWNPGNEGRQPPHSPAGRNTCPGDSAILGAARGRRLLPADRPLLPCTFQRMAQFMVLEVRMNRERRGDAATRGRGDIPPSPPLRLSSSPPLPFSPTPHRRDFLRRSLGIALGGTLVPYFSIGRQAKAQSKTDRPRLAAIGLGGQGVGIARAAMRHADLVACCDVDRTRAEKFARGGKAAIYDDFRKLLERPDVDLVTIATPDHWHAAIAIRAMRSGKDVYCEKPLTLTIEESQAVRRTVLQTGRVLQVGTQQRSMGLFLKALALVKKGRLGRVSRAVCAIGAGPRGGPFAPQPPPPGLNWDFWLGQAPKVPYLENRCHYNFRWWLEYSGGKLTDWGTHHLDIAQWGLGHQLTGPVRIEGQGVLPAGKNCYNTPTTFGVTLTFADGTTIEVRHGPDPGPWIEPSPLPLSLTCPDPRLALDNGIWFEGSLGRIFVNRKKLAGRPVEES